MKKLSLLFLMYFSAILLHSNDSISTFVNEMDHTLRGSNENYWELTLRLPESKVQSRLIVGIAGNTNSEDAIKIFNDIDNLISEYFNNINIEKNIGRILHFIENIEPISYQELEDSGKDYFDLEFFLLDNGMISEEEDEADIFKLLQRISYRTEGVDNLITGIERTFYLDVNICDHDRFQKIMTLIENDVNKELLD